MSSQTPCTGTSGALKGQAWGVSSSSKAPPGPGRVHFSPPPPHSFPRGVVTKHHRPGALKQQKQIFSRLEARSPKSGYLPARPPLKAVVLPRLLRLPVSLAVLGVPWLKAVPFQSLPRGPPSCHTASFPVCPSVSLMTFSRGHRSLDSGPALMQCDLILTAFTKTLVPNSYSEVLGECEFGGQALFNPVHLLWVKNRADSSSPSPQGSWPCCATSDK